MISWSHIFTKVECNEYCVNVLKSRQQEGCLPACSISKDVAEYIPSGRALEAELVTAGFPRQAKVADCPNHCACFHAT